MINEKDKQAIINGAAYGITRKSSKVKYLFKSDINQQNRYLFVEYVEREGKVDFHNSLWLSEDFTFYANSTKEHNLDVIGLWEDYCLWEDWLRED